MLKIVGIGFVGFLLQLLGQAPIEIETAQSLLWHESAIFQLPSSPNPTMNTIATQYLQTLAGRGVPSSKQGIWVQSGLDVLANHEGKRPISAASLTKIATSLAALEKWSANHQFETQVARTGSVEDGVLQGDLIIMGGGDPLFLWEEAIALGNSLNRLGIRKVTGDLIIVGDFSMNDETNPTTAGKLLKQGFNHRTWSNALTAQYRVMPEGTLRPDIEITGTVKALPTLDTEHTLLIRHSSLTVANILKYMNLYSNNALSERLADQVGGAQAIADLASESASFPREEIQLINGSGLGVDNRISPRASTAMLMAIERKLQSNPIGITDLFPVAGRDRRGTMRYRDIPAGTAIKTGTLRQVSALAGVVPTRDRGLVWFAIINEGTDLAMLRAQQDQFLQRVAQNWGIEPITFTEELDFLGNPERNLVL